MNRRNFFKAVAYGVGAMAVPIKPIEGHAALIEDDLSRFEWSAWAEHAYTLTATPNECFYFNNSDWHIDNPQGSIYITSDQSEAPYIDVFDVEESIQHMDVLFGRFVLRYRQYV